MNSSLKVDFVQMQYKLRTYVEKGRLAIDDETKDEPLMNQKPEASRIKPLKKISAFEGSFIAVDCSTRTLKRANNWGIYLMRSSYVIVKERMVDWGFDERIFTAIGDGYSRSNYLKGTRMELESQMALNVLQNRIDLYYDHQKDRNCHDHTADRAVYLLLDGSGVFGGERRFRVSLYDKCQKLNIRLLAISKNSPTLRDEKGRDFMATAQALSHNDIWFYHPVECADKKNGLYGDITLIKLCSDSPYVFRCDVMDYLTKQDIGEVLSPLTSVSEDPRCVGYPISLFLAHEFSAPSDSMLLNYHDQVEEKLNEAGLLEILRTEERSCNFADELHGVRHPFEREIWDAQY
ncbi:MAG: hypothetical protein NWE98_05965 [Candidatus Bathyarchaeota archaeon]|nr:hypothetical protein [Candidatus Bathyarchaeota archaeon]